MTNQKVSKIVGVVHKWRRIYMGVLQSVTFPYERKWKFCDRGGRGIQKSHFFAERHLWTAPEDFSSELNSCQPTLNPNIFNHEMPFNLSKPLQNYLENSFFNLPLLLKRHQHQHLMIHLLSDPYHLVYPVIKKTIISVNVNIYKHVLRMV